MKQTIKTANKTIFISLLVMTLTFCFVGCDNPTGDECTVTFNLDGGNINGDVSSVRIPVKKGTTIDHLPSPQKTNNTFDGWYTGTNGSGNEFKTTTVVTSNMVVFAKWTSSGDSGTQDGNGYTIIPDSVLFASAFSQYD